MVLILSDENDAHANVVVEELIKMNTDFVRLDLNTSALLKTFATYKSGVWEIITENNRFYSSQIKAIWNRRTYVELLLEESDDDDADFKIWKNEWNKTLLGLHYSILDRYWLNNYRNSQRAENKYLQMDTAKKLGLLMPDIIVSNQKKDLLDFANKYQHVALKLMYQDFYKVNNDSYNGFYVNRIKKEDLLNFKENQENPIVLQEYVEKKYEVRYTVVGDSHFVCKINSQESEKTKYDWRRYDLARTPHSIIEPPLEVYSKVCELMKILDLEFGALDFIVTQNDEWYFLEINPMGQYLWIENLTGLKISNSIANLLSLRAK